MSKIDKILKVAKFIKTYNIENTNIIKNGTDYFIDVDGDVNLSNKGLSEITVKFRHITGNFNCSGCHLTSLDFAPDFVGGDFDCSNNELTSLKGCPKEIKGYFDCMDNPNLKSLKGIGKVSGQIYSDFFEGKIENYGKKN